MFDEILTVEVTFNLHIGHSERFVLYSELKTT